MDDFDKMWKAIPDDVRDEGIDRASAQWGWNACAESLAAKHAEEMKRLSNDGCERRKETPMPDKPMTPEELAGELTKHYFSKWNAIITAYTESIRREAKRETLNRASNECVDAALVAMTRGYQQYADACHACASRIFSLPIDTPPAADRAPEAVCPRCKGRGSVISWHIDKDNECVDCPDCHGTGKRAPDAGKGGEK